MGTPRRTSNDLGFDPDALRDKYRAEREKRLRKDGNDQYLPLEQDGLEDLYGDPNFARTPIDEAVDFLIVGGGWGGLLIAVRLIEAGVTNIRIVEKAGDFGGVWYWNRYPGAACDMESYIYMPLLEEMGYMPSEKYAKGPELLAYARAIGKKYGLYDKVLFQTELLTLEWDEEAARWNGSTSRNDNVRARFVATASGPLHNPKIPRLPGRESYKGRSFHTTRWDYGFTGGDVSGGLDRISDKRIGIVGTGATALQAIPHLAEGAKHLYVFQRTPSSVDVRNDGPTDEEWAAKLTPGWQKRRMENFNTIVTGGKVEEDLVNDSWTDILRNLSFVSEAKTVKDLGGDTSLRQLADFNKMERVRARVESLVENPATAEKLKPWYNQFCKRPCFHDHYLQTYNRPNVTLVDTGGRGIERMTEAGVIANGEEYELDCVIYATGFEYAVSHTNRSALVVRGRGGTTLAEKWKDGASTFHGLYSNGFPNLYVVSLLQSGLTPNLPHMLEEQATHIAYVTSHCVKKGIRTMECSADAEESWVQTIVELGKFQEEFFKECTPGYYNNEGKESEAVLRNSTYGLGSPAFIQLLRDWREAGQLQGLECR